ncbi:MAG: MgtC/SapB family protein [bacterium]|nr:MgtC/SapB family protein [bacterium]
MVGVPLETQIAVGLQLVLTAILSGLIGLDRERNRNNAGLRTHILVGVGACLFTALSVRAFGEGDPGRVAAQIVTGIGFLGAGAILKENRRIRGLTTAASIWTTAAVGMAVAAGAWLIAIIATLIVWLVLSALIRLEPYGIQPKDDA